MIKADKSMKRIFFSEVATLLLHRWENWLYQLFILPHTHEAGSSSLLQPSGPASPSRQGKRKKAWMTPQYSGQTSPKLFFDLHCSLLSSHIRTMTWVKTERMPVYPVVPCTEAAPPLFFHATALCACCPLLFQWENQNCKYTQDSGTSRIYTVTLILPSSIPNPNIMFYIFDLSPCFLITIF